MIIELIAVLVGKAALAPLKTGLSILADIRDRRVRQVVERVGRQRLPARSLRAFLGASVPAR